MPFHLKMTGYSSTDDARVKVPSIQKVTIFLTIWNIPQRCHSFVFLLLWKCFWLPWLKTNTLQMICFNQTPLFCYVIAWWQTLPTIGIQLFACSLHIDRTVLYALLSVIRYWNFQRLCITTRFTILVWKLKIKNAKYRLIDFLSFTFKPKVRSSSEMFVITKWTNQVLFCLGYLVQIN